MSDEIVVVPEEEKIVTVPTEYKKTLFDLPPKEMVARVTEIANCLSDVIKNQKLFVNIQGKNYVKAEGWSTLGAFLSVLPKEIYVTEHQDGSYEARVDLINSNTGITVGGASAIVGMDEQTWAKRPKFARRSMAVTRATSKAFRLAFGWISSIAGYEATPAEELEAAQPPQTVTATTSTLISKMQQQNQERIKQ